MMAHPEFGKIGIKKSDIVEVIAGREKGKSGKVLFVDRKTARVTVEKVNMVKRHVKPSQKYPQGGLIEKESALHYSNVQMMCPKCNRGVRYGHKMIEVTAKKGKKAAASTSKKIRVCKRCDGSLEASA